VLRARDTSAQEESTLPRPSIGYSFEHTPVLSQEAVVRESHAPGRPLPSTLKGEVERSTGARLDDVRIHTGPASNEAASALRARAYTIGQDIHFAANQFRPGTPGGDRLLIHETLHTLQQGASSTPVARTKLEVGTPGDPAEREADAWAEAILDGRKSGARSSTVPEPPPPGKLTQVPNTRIQRQVDETSAQKRPSYTDDQASRDAVTLYNAALGGLTGLGTDEEVIWSILEKRTKKELDLIRQKFREHYRLELDAVLRDEFSETDLERLNALLAGDKGLAGAIAIHDHLSHIGFSHGEEIIRVLQQASPTERQAIAQAFHRKYRSEASHLSTATPTEFLRRLITPYLATRSNQQQQVNDLLATTLENKPGQVTRLEANVAGAQVRNSLWERFGADAVKVLEQLKQLPSEQRSRLRHDIALMNEMRAKLSPQDFASAKALLEGKLAAYDAALIRKALEGWSGPDKTALLNLLKGKTASELRSIQLEFAMQTQTSLQKAIMALGEPEASVMWSYLNPPATNDPGSQATADARRIRLAIDSPGTDEQALREVLSNKSKLQITRITEAYKRLFGDNLREELESELSGRDEFDILQMFDLGAIDDKAPGAAQQKLDRLKAQQQAEQSLGLGLINQVQTLMKGESDEARLTRQLTTAQWALKHGKVNAARQRLGYATDDLQTLRETKNSVAETTSSLAVGAMTTGAVIMTGGAATPLAILGYSALGAGTRMATQRIIHGEALGGEDLLQQGVMGLGEGATAIIPMPKGGSLLSGGVGQATKPALSQRLGSTLLKASYESAVGGAATGALNQTLESDTWSNGVLPGLGRVVKGAGKEAVLGVPSGVAKELALGVVSHGAKRISQRWEIDVRQNPSLSGSTTRVRTEHGRVYIEAGPAATAEHIQAHMETARSLQLYQGRLGQLRRLSDRIQQAYTHTPGYGTQGFESRLEVVRLRGMIDELEQKIPQYLDDPTRGGLETLHQELVNLRSQLQFHEGLIGSLAPGRGYLSTDAREPFQSPSSQTSSQPSSEPSPENLSSQPSSELIPENSSSQPSSELSPENPSSQPFPQLLLTGRQPLLALPPGKPPPLLLPPADPSFRQTVDQGIESVRGHVIAPHFVQRAMRKVGGNKTITLTPTQDSPSPFKNKFDAETTVSIEKLPGAPADLDIKNMVLLNPDTSEVIGGVGTMQVNGKALWQIPSSLPDDSKLPLVRITLRNDETFTVLPGDPLPSGYRYTILPSQGFQQAGFSGGHTREAWNQSLKTYEDIIRTGTQEAISFRLSPEDSQLITITREHYEVFKPSNLAGQPDTWKTIHNPKTLFESPGHTSLLAFEQHMAPYVAKALENATNAKQLLVEVPVFNRRGFTTMVKVVVTCEPDETSTVPKITSWWIGELNFNDHDLRIPPWGPLPR
jgi:type III secretion translocon protein HrpF